VRRKKREEEAKVIKLKRNGRERNEVEGNKTKDLIKNKSFVWTT
jgi:hypothetical protein